MTDPAERIAHAIGRFGLKVARIGEVPDSHSSIVRILTLEAGGEVVLKIPWSRGKWEKECEALRTLEGMARAPRLLDAFADEHEAYAILMSRLPGEPIGSAERCTVALAAQAGETLATVHQRSLPPTGTDAEAIGWWPWLQATFVEGTLASCRRHGIPGDWDLVERVFSETVATFPPVTDLRLVMFDCRLGNLLARDGELTGIIDFESARNGSRDIDFVNFHREFEAHPALYAAVRAGYAAVLPLPPDLERTMPFYRMYQSVASVGFSLKRGRGAGDAFFDANLAAVHRSIAVLRDRA